ncbi:FtsK/SpoIIIE domain-containing protein [Bacillus seohaeanensis]|uniref:FtsK/SpoIIIE domain-containing protein n=1 Tax=Bacillus seohaeanensis TaxID=284580 RepID=A0ABW5RPL6_9BACI
MIFEILTSSLMGGLALKAHLAKNGVGNDSKKLNKIFALSDLNVKDGKETLTTQLIKKRDFEWGIEYRYRIPLGRSFEDYKNKLKTIEAGINRRNVTIQLKDLRELKIDKNIIDNIKTLYQKKLTHNKEIELSYDGMLIVRAYNNSLPKLVDYQQGKEWKVSFGIAREKNQSVFHDFEKIPHLALGGATKYGKSNLINSIIVSLIKQQSDNVKLHLIDLKGGVELCDYENINQTVSIAYEPEEALTTLINAYKSMRDMQKKLREMGKKNVQEADIKDRHFIIIDEVGELNPSEAIDKEERELKQLCQRYMSQISRLGAGLGFRLILATQYPTGDVIPRQCKQNSDGKLCFRVQSGTASRVVLDEDGAENLPEIKGRAIYQSADKRIIVQTPLITPETIQQTIKPHIKKVKEGLISETVKRETRKNIAVFETTGLSQS